MKKLIKLLVKIGIVCREEDGSIKWPIHILPWDWWVALFRGSGSRAGFFRNRPGVIKWIPGRLLPRRWGFYILGFEFGDRGAGATLIEEKEL